jgi:ABC-type sulfate/molybdate transport systems ATPase subunit
MLGKREVNSRAYVAVQLHRRATSRRRRRALRRRAQPRPPGEALEARRQLLLLDEPTNDLDVDTLRALEERCSTSPAAPS